MSALIGTGVSTHGDARVGAIEAAHAAGQALMGQKADLAIVFASGAHLAAPEATLEGIHEALRPPALIGCGAGGVLGCGAEHEGGTAVAVWAASLGGGSATTFHATAQQIDESIAVTGMEDLAGARGAILLPDPFSFPTDALLMDLATRAPGVPVVGGLSSARTAEGTTALFHGDRVVDSGAVGVRLDGVELLPCVSQGATPLGPEMTITAAEGNVITELAGRPALDHIRKTIEQLDARDRTLIAGGLLVGIVVDGGQPEYDHGDFLVRGLLGADPVAGTIAVAANVQPGQVLRLHARDAASADRDLHDQLKLRVDALGGAPAGALAFACHSRGREMFGVADHDAGLLADELAGAPSAGFFAAGEIGPVGGASFMHSFTATVALFA
ncbi:FIST N-terminal domain-containing protein [Conexibacter sp. CPCC 206217]|uniref:FIST signal transduction protein n=1 Tax=Conexibacter sp. CPCC 206217 TaxID=3064574 RepID=UPI0027221400|nr:FIST N-terminal domain-containing protein [Conexibacter sp. CPCC 206217]MDO8210542.1 FIST N-terminal domain-containing protein [Conexibacter sp. CPCC 206217]